MDIYHVCHRDTKRVVESSSSSPLDDPLNLHNSSKVYIIGIKYEMANTVYMYDNCKHKIRNTPTAIMLLLGMKMSEKQMHT